jgi:hypothetical protein
MHSAGFRGGGCDAGFAEAVPEFLGIVLANGRTKAIGSVRASGCGHHLLGKGTRAGTGLKETDESAGQEGLLQKIASVGHVARPLIGGKIPIV